MSGCLSALTHVPSCSQTRQDKSAPAAARYVERSCASSLPSRVQEIGLDKHARSCLSAVTNGAGKLRKRLAAKDESEAPSNVEVEADGAGTLRKRMAAEDENEAPSNVQSVEVEAPSPKRARLS